MAKVCRQPGCPVIIPADAYRGLCPTHRREADQARGSRNDRGYGNQHQIDSRAWQAKADAGELVLCWRCQQPITGNVHLGHDDHDRTLTRGPEHEHCNLSAAGKASHKS